jgi:hypothetical protein
VIFLKIAENILKHSLSNVYFLAGTPCGGKTTMAQALSQKYGFIHFNDNWHEENFNTWLSIVDPKYQKRSTVRKQVTDWEAYFSRSIEQFLAGRAGYNENDEYIEFALIELVKLSQTRPVVADISIPMELLTQLSDYSRIACLLAPPELVIRDYYGRNDHREFIECIMSLKNPEEKLATQNKLFEIGVNEIFADVEKYKLFSIVRDENSTIDKTLALLEAHFGLK